MGSTNYKYRGHRKSKARVGSLRLIYLILVLCLLGLVAGGFALRSSQPIQASTSQYVGVPGPDDWTDETSVEIYNRRNGQWEPMTYGDVGPYTEFIVGDVLYATTETGNLFLKPEIDISRLTEADQSFEPDNWRMPEPDDVVFLFKSSSNQQTGHWLLKHVQPDSEVVFQGRVWKWELDAENQRFVVSDTGNVFARVTAVHQQVHDGDVLALIVQYDSCGKTDIITGSEEHPFYVIDKTGYMPMVLLEPGMKLKTDNGALASVVEIKPLDEIMTLHNLTVEYAKSFYVYASNEDTGILVHNTNCGKVPLIGGGTDLPEGVQWGKIDQIQHLHPPDVPYKQESVAEALKDGYDPTKPIPIMIEADGTWVAVGGNHRLAWAREKGYSEIPVRIILDNR